MNHLSCCLKKNKTRKWGRGGFRKKTVFFTVAHVAVAASAGPPLSPSGQGGPPLRRAPPLLTSPCSLSLYFRAETLGVDLLPPHPVVAPAGDSGRPEPR